MKKNAILVGLIVIVLTPLHITCGESNNAFNQFNSFIEKGTKLYKEEVTKLEKKIADLDRRPSGGARGRWRSGQRRAAAAGVPGGSWHRVSRRAEGGGDGQGADRDRDGSRVGTSSGAS